MQRKDQGDRLLVVGSVTHAMRGKEILYSHGIKAYVQRVRASRSYGCGYGLLIKAEVSAAAEILSRAGIKVLAVVEL